MIFEDVLQLTGWGTYQRGMLTLCGFGFITEGAAVMLIHFVLPLTNCSYHIVGDKMLWLHSISSLGTAIGGFLFTSMGDTIGRKAPITTPYIFIFMGLLGCSFSATASMLAICMFLLSMGIGTYSSACRVYLMEILPQHKRASMLVLMDFLWSIGHHIGVGLYVLLLPPIKQHSGSASRLKFFTWRIFFAFVGTISLFLASTLAFLGSSPRYLIAMRRLPVAEDVLKQMYTINNNKHGSTFEVPNLEGTVEESPLQYRPTVCSDHMGQIFRGYIKFIRVLFCKKIVYRTLLCMLIATCFLLGNSMVTLWFSRLLKISEKQNGSVSHDCEIGSRSIFIVDHVHKSRNRILCNYHNEHSLDYVAILSTLSILGRLTLMFTIEHIKRTILLAALLFTACICSCVMPFFELHYLRVCLAGGFVFCYTGAESVFNVISVEIFPTAVRGTASGIIPLIGRIGMIFVLRYFWMTCFIVLGSMSACMLIAAITTVFLPDRAKKPAIE